jgi:hypothetical protein
MKISHILYKADFHQVRQAINYMDVKKKFSFICFFSKNIYFFKGFFTLYSEYSLITGLFLSALLYIMFHINKTNCMFLIVLTLPFSRIKLII